MRPLVALAALVAVASTAAATPAGVRRTVSLARAREGLPVALPANPWTAVRRVELPSPCATPVVALPHGELVVGLEAPPALAFLSSDGDHVRVVPLQRRITQPLAVGRDGRVWVVADRFVFTLAPDGTVRSSAELLSRIDGPAIVRADGSAVVLSGTPQAPHEFFVLSPAGDPVGVRSSGARNLSESTLLGDGRLLTAGERALVSLSARDVVTRIATVPEVRRLAPLGEGVAMTTERALLLADRDAVVQRRVDLPDTVLWLAPYGVGRVGLAVAGAVPQLWVVTADGTVTARAPLPPGSSAPLVDPTGAALVPARGGDVLCVDRDGAERWRLTLHETLRPPAVPLPRGGVAIATEGAQVLLLRDGT
jgi:hypothetical protein